MSLAVGQNSLTPEGNNNLNFRLAGDTVVHVETAENLFSRLHQCFLFFLCFGRYSEILNDWPHGNSGVCFSPTLHVTLRHSSILFDNHHVDGGRNVSLNFYVLSKNA